MRIFARRAVGIGRSALPVSTNATLVGRRAFSAAPRTMFDKILADHRVHEADGNFIMYIDRHIVHEVTSPQAFEGLRDAGRPVRRPDCTLVTSDHNVPTDSRANFKDAASFIEQEDSRTQVVTLEDNVVEFGLTYFGMTDKRQGIVHVIGPEQGFTLPGTTVVCGDSHTATHGAMGALAMGIGTSEVEHVLATQCLVMPKLKNMRITVEGTLGPGVTSKDVIMHIIGIIGTAGGQGYVLEYCGNVIEAMTVEARMSLCNMSIEAGSRAGLVAPDDKTCEYIKGRPMAPKGETWDKAVAYWKSLKSDDGAVFDKEVHIDAADIVPCVTWGTTPEDVVPITGSVPDPAKAESDQKRASMERMLAYMDLKPNTPMQEIEIQHVFIGSCTNSRIEDLRAAAAVLKGHKVADGVSAMVVPGSGLVKLQAEAEGLDKIFMESGFDWREPGCSMCLGMNPDQIPPRERCASTSNRNFEGRQGAYARTHLVSPAMAAASAVRGKLADVRDFTAALDSPQLESLEFVGSELPVPPPPRGAKPQRGSGAGSGSGGAGGMPKLTTLDSVVAAPLRMSNVDTDCIIPAQFLKTIKRSGLGSAAFYEIRYHADGTEDPDFILNQEPFRQAEILIVLENFGCGSSREHAPWALKDFGIRVIIAPSFADIFSNNCFKNGMLPLVLPKEQVEELMQDAEAKKRLSFDLEKQVVIREDGSSFAFEVHSFRKHCLLNGLDDVGLTLQKADEIASFESMRSEKFPWLDGPGYNQAAA